MPGTVSHSSTEPGDEDHAVWDVLNNDLFFVRDVVKRHELKSSEKLDVYRARSRQLVLECREPQIGSMTKIRRAIGGIHDVSSGFDFTAHVPGISKPALKISRQPTEFNLTGGATTIADHDGEKLGTIKRGFLFGTRLFFTASVKSECLSLKWKTNWLGSRANVLLNGKAVAKFDWNWKGEQREFFDSERFLYAFWIAPEVNKHSRLRQVLLALGIAQHRIRCRPLREPHMLTT